MRLARCQIQSVKKYNLNQRADKLLCGLAKIIVVALAFVFFKLAELSFHTEYYYAACCAAFIATACLATLFGMATKSNLLMIYSSIYIVGGLLYSLMMIPEIAMSIDHIYYDSKINFSLIITFADSFIIVTGGINVIYRFYTMCRYGSDSDDFFDARVGLHKWAR